MSSAEMMRIWEMDGQRALEAYIEHHTEVRYRGRDMMSMEDELDIRREKISEIEIALDELDGIIGYDTLRGVLECYLEDYSDEADELEAELHGYYEMDDRAAVRDYWREVL